MKTNFTKGVFALLLAAVVILTGCKNEETPDPNTGSESPSCLLLESLSIEAGGETYDVTIPTNNANIIIKGVKHGVAVTGVKYELADDVTSVEPTFESLIGVWNKEEKIKISTPTKSITYNVVLADYDPEYPIKQYGDIVIEPEEYFGETITDYYYDIKFLTKWVQNEEMARELFVEDRMNGVRLPILGTVKKQAHPEAGTVVASMYDESVATVENARAVIGDKKFTVFASKKLEGKESFPAWTKNEDGVIPAQYVKLLVDYIMHMKGRGIEIDVLGIDNEFRYNEGNISPEKHNEIVTLLRDEATKNNFKMPLIIGPEKYEPMGDVDGCWIRDFYQKGYSENMDIYGTHYYPLHRFKDKLEYELGIVKGKPFWATEPHWTDNDEAKADMMLSSEDSICALWDQTDLGMSGFMWWGYSRNGSLRDYLMRAVSTPLLDSRPVKVYDVDGEDIMTKGKLQTRAFRSGKTMNLYVINVVAKGAVNGAPAYPDYTIGINMGEIAGDVTCHQWRDDTEIEGEVTSITSDDNIRFKCDIPARSITYFSFEMK